MISSASNSQGYTQTHAVSTTSSVSTTSVSSTTAPSSTTSSQDQLDGVNGFKSAWHRQLDQEKHVQGAGKPDHKSVESMQQTQQTQTVADMLSQERLKKA